MVNGHATMTMRLARGGFDQIFANDVTQPSITASVTQVKAISSGFHLEAVIAVDSVRAGEPFSLTVKVTNDAGSVIQEINSAVTLEVRNAGSQAPGSGTLLTSQFQLLQGQRTVSETYTFAEPIVIIAYDDAGNAPATTNVLTVKPGQPSAIQLTSSPEWVGGNKHATLTRTTRRRLRERRPQRGHDVRRDQRRRFPDVDRQPHGRERRCARRLPEPARSADDPDPRERDGAHR